MERYYSRQVQSTPNVQTEGVEASGSRQAQTFPPSSTVGAPQIQEPNLSGSVNRTPEESESFSAESDGGFDENSLVLDPALRTKISSFHPNVRDQVRRFFLQKGPIQPKSHAFPARNFSGRQRKFQASWFKKYNWLDYSVSKDAAYCLYCYVFSKRGGSNDGFIGEGFRIWNKLKAFDDHVGEHNSYHNRAKNSSDLLLKQARGIEAALFRQSDQAKRDYRIRLVASLDCIRWLVVNGLSFRGHDESATSSNRGNFLQLLDFHALGREDVQRVVGRNAPKNLQLTSPKIQRDLIHAMACETTKKIIAEIGYNFFCILVDETRDISMKEQMAIVLRYVNSDGGAPVAWNQH
ncbi:unnamed protein product [Linum tenue]|uniref:TTF-type domain-containing protein n=1 Tax=Linum tenue TaxID=586396 RepID=A0AAV0MHR0_9ROSI|nr:unnamed protein product [Linum tenue]